MFSIEKGLKKKKEERKKKRRERRDKVVDTERAVLSFFHETIKKNCQKLKKMMACPPKKSFFLSLSFPSSRFFS